MSANTNNRLHILQNGIPRSGNLWLHYLLRRCLAEAGIEISQFISGHPVARLLDQEDLGINGISQIDFINIEPLQNFFTIRDVFRWPIEDMPHYIEASTHVATHSVWNEASRETYNRFSHVIYVIRDPRDTAISLSRFDFTPFNRLHRPSPFDSPETYLDYHLVNLMHTWVQHVAAHIKNRQDINIHFVFYERLLSEPEKELQRLITFLDLNLDDNSCQRVLDDTGFETIKKAQTHHLNKGQWGQWRGSLSNYQARQTEQIAGPMLHALGYPQTHEEAKDWSLSPELNL